MLAAPSAFVADYVAGNHGERLRSLWAAQRPGTRRVMVQVQAGAARIGHQQTRRAGTRLAPVDRLGDRRRAHDHARTAAERPVVDLAVPAAGPAPRIDQLDLDQPATAGTTVAPRATLELAGTISTLADVLTLNGKLASYTGSNTYNGDITLNTGAAIDVGTGSTLVLKKFWANGPFTKTGGGWLVAGVQALQ